MDTEVRVRSRKRARKILKTVPRAHERKYGIHVIHRESERAENIATVRRHVISIRTRKTFFIAGRRGGGVLSLATKKRVWYSSISRLFSLGLNEAYFLRTLCKLFVGLTCRRGRMAAGSASSCTYLTIISSDALSMHFSITLDENFCIESIATCSVTRTGRRSVCYT